MTQQVTLSESEIALASAAAKARFSNSRAMHLNQKIGDKGNEHGQNDLIGAKGEAAFAKFLNGPSSPPLTVNTFKSIPDVGKYEVRTRSKPLYDLFVRKDDPDNRPFVLVLSHLDPTFIIVGWILGKDAKQPLWLKNHGGFQPAYFVPRSALHPF